MRIRVVFRKYADVSLVAGFVIGIVGLSEPSVTWAQSDPVPRRSYAQPTTSSGTSPSYRVPASGRSNAVPRRTFTGRTTNNSSIRYRLSPESRYSLGNESRRTYHRLIGPVPALEYSDRPFQLGRVTNDRLNRNIVIPPQVLQAQVVVREAEKIPHTLLGVQRLPSLSDAEIAFRIPEMQTQQSSGGVDGWLMLNAGQDSQALRYFAEQTLKNSRQGDSRIGYGLLLAFKGDLDRATFAFRRACDVDIDALAAFRSENKPDRLQESMQKRIRKLISDYGQHGQTHPNSGAGFSKALLYVLLNENESAAVELEKSGKSGDSKSSTTALQEFISR